MKQLICAKSAGFCAGVARSVAMAEEALKAHGEVWCIGELIHNRTETERLAQLGLRIVADADAVRVCFADIFLKSLNEEI